MSAILITGGVVASGCTDEADPRAQLLLVLDTDAPIPELVFEDETYSPDAAIDTIRVDVFQEDGSVVVFRDFVASSRFDWPVSFGIVTEGAPTDPIRLRVRAFRAGMASGEYLAGDRVLEPAPGSAIDRLVDIPLPRQGVTIARVTLSLDCFGSPPDFLAEATCIDGTEPGAPEDGVELLAEAPTSSAIGTAARSREQPCQGAPDGTVCIPGGFTMLGDLALVGWGALSLDAAPLRPVYVSSFALDETEMTVGHLRALVNDDLVKTLPQTAIDTSDASCTWLSPTLAQNDDLPVNCLTQKAAAEVCEARGGFLPSEAQWEHAARGRGLRYEYPWGNDAPSCCVATYGDIGFASDESCDGVDGPEEPGSHPPSDACNGLGDISRDGVLDMAGNVAEYTRDKLQPYDAPCWQSDSLLIDPQCEAESANVFASRGGDFASAEGYLLSYGRHASAVLGRVGFRCAFEVDP